MEASRLSATIGKAQIEKAQVQFGYAVNSSHSLRANINSQRKLSVCVSICTPWFAGGTAT